MAKRFNQFRIQDSSLPVRLDKALVDISGPSFWGIPIEVDRGPFLGGGWEQGSGVKPPFR